MAESRQTYSPTQRVALETVKQEGLPLGAARPDFVNHVMYENGFISADTQPMIDKASAELARILAIEPKTPDVLREATRASEIQDHIAQNRFLFIADDDGLPLIYFQCATPGNPDVFPQEG
jgi:hypothetical protein